VAQLTPPNPWTQLQLYASTRLTPVGLELSEHVALFALGEDIHSFTFWSQLPPRTPRQTPETSEMKAYGQNPLAKPGLQEHVYASGGGATTGGSTHSPAGGGGGHPSGQLSAS
jgi:hypothetical protein